MEATFESNYWARVVGLFRKVCILHREGKHSESRRILEHDLRRGIAEWAKVSPKDAQTKRSKLEQMFGEEQRRVDDAWMVQSMILRQFSEQILPALSNRLVSELRTAMHPAAMPSSFAPAQPVAATSLLEDDAPLEPESRVAFDDVAGMIDILLSSEAGRRRRLDAFAPV